MYYIYIHTGWWFGTFLFFHILGRIVPTDRYVSEGWLNHQPVYIELCLHILISVLIELNKNTSIYRLMSIFKVNPKIYFTEKGYNIYLVNPNIYLFHLIPHVYIWWIPPTSILFPHIFQWVLQHFLQNASRTPSGNSMDGAGRPVTLARLYGCLWDIYIYIHVYIYI